jgi:hypothetical protein
MYSKSILFEFLKVYHHMFSVYCWIYIYIYIYSLIQVDNVNPIKDELLKWLMDSYWNVE